jgi:VWFA-related protein/TonB family protein
MTHYLPIGFVRIMCGRLQRRVVRGSSMMRYLLISLIFLSGLSVSLLGQEPSNAVPKLEHSVVPEYPPIAKMARIQGQVVVVVTLDEEGKVAGLGLKSGPPLLVRAAMDAVRQCKFAKPAFSPMKFEVTVDFELPDAVKLELGQAVAPQPPASTVRATTQEVLLDVVVRDKKGRAVTDLKPDDFQILDNGDARPIKSFRLIQGGETISGNGTRTQLDPLRQIRLVTMIFQCFDTQALRLAHDTAADLLKGELPQNVYISVMTIDHKLEVLQPFTNDPDLLRKAIDRATRSGSTDFSNDTETVQKQLEQIVGPNTTGAQSTQEQVDNMAAGTNPADKEMAQMLLTTIQTEQSSAMTQAGRTSIWALLDAVKEQYRLPGRKTVLYFSEGFVIPLGVEGPFQEIISIANRSNVSFYDVDARGLTSVSTNQAAIDSLKSVAQSSHDQATAVGGTPVRRDQANLIDNSLMSIRANSQSALGTLAESTGGELIANTNDLRAPLRRLAEDIQTYYEITYDPGIKVYDGSFRKITINMSSRDLHVQSRSGYVALPPSLAAGGTVLHAYEVPLLAALGSPDLPLAFGFEARALRFRGRENQPVCDVVIDLPLTNVTFQPAETKGEFDARLAYVALLKDDRGEVVKKFQNEVPIKIPAAKLEGVRASHFIYTEHFDLAPGQYTLEAAVLDGDDRISARKSSVTMPPPSTELGLSSIAVIRSVKQKDASTQADDPLLAEAQVVSPTLDPVISKSEAQTVSFYMVVYPDKSLTASPQLVMEFSRNGKVLGAGSPALSPPDKNGRIPYLAVVPLASFQPGDFTVRAIAKQGSETVQESAAFTLR